MRLENTHKIHFVGIKGIAMSALAVYCAQRGFAISGSDTEEPFPSDEILQHISPVLYGGFKPEHVKNANPDLVIYTGAHNARMNAEVQAALAAGIPVLPHGQALGEFMKGSRQISVAGCHGKTTTASMISTILLNAELDPSYVIGSGLVRGLGLPGHFGKGNIFVAEADEYVTEPQYDLTPRFLWQIPDVLVVTNVDYDHPDVYPDLDAVKAAYGKLRDNVSPGGTIIINGDDVNSTFLSGGDRKVITVGSRSTSSFVVRGFRVKDEITSFTLRHNGESHALTIGVPGLHNAFNAAMAAAAVRSLHLPWDVIEKGLKQFSGAKRRFELIGVNKGISYFDDYAHHPREIAATLKAARLRFGKQRIIVVFQPHTYSRTKALRDEFARSFSDADSVILTEIYGSAREGKMNDISGEILYEQTAENHKNVRFAPTPDDVAKILKKITGVGDVVFFMGAGDIYSWEKQVVEALA